MAMIRLPRDFSEFLKLLNSNGARCLLVGNSSVLKSAIRAVDDLKRNKRAAGRHKDLADLEQIEQ